jgi:hypothetical protein
MWRRTIRPIAPWRRVGEEALRGPGESYSDVILRVAKGEGGGRTGTLGASNVGFPNILR